MCYKLAKNLPITGEEQSGGGGGGLGFTLNLNVPTFFGRDDCVAFFRKALYFCSWGVNEHYFARLNP